MEYVQGRDPDGRAVSEQDITEVIQQFSGKPIECLCKKGHFLLSSLNLSQGEIITTTCVHNFSVDENKLQAFPALSLIACCEQAKGFLYVYSCHK